MPPKSATTKRDRDAEPAIAAAVKKARAVDRPVCQFGSDCYRKNPDHFDEFRHPHIEEAGDGDDDNIEKEEADGDGEADGGDDEDDEDGRKARKDLPPLPDNLQKELDEKAIIPCQLQAWPLDTVKTSSTEPKHRHFAFLPLLESATGDEKLPRDVSKFGGSPYLLPGEEKGVICQCGQSMAFFFQLLSQDFPAHLKNVFIPDSLRGDDKKPMFQFFCCVGDCETFEFSLEVCRPRWVDATNPSVEQIETEDVVRQSVMAKEKKLTGWNQKEDRPNSEEATSEWKIDGVDDADDLFQPISGEKMSGFPAWVQGIEYFECAECGKRNELLFQLDSEQTFDWMWGDAGTAQITVCPDHRDKLHFGWACG